MAAILDLSRLRTLGGSATNFFHHFYSQERQWQLFRGSSLWYHAFHEITYPPNQRHRKHGLISCFCCSSCPHNILGFFSRFSLYSFRIYFFFFFSPLFFFCHVFFLLMDLKACKDYSLYKQNADTFSKVIKRITNFNRFTTQDLHHSRVTFSFFFPADRGGKPPRPPPSAP